MGIWLSVALMFARTVEAWLTVVLLGTLCGARDVVRARSGPRDALLSASSAICVLSYCVILLMLISLKTVNLPSSEIDPTKHMFLLAAYFVSNAWLTDSLGPSLVVAMICVLHLSVFMLLSWLSAVIALSKWKGPESKLIVFANSPGLSLSVWAVYAGVAGS